MPGQQPAHHRGDQGEKRVSDPNEVHGRAAGSPSKARKNNPIPRHKPVTTGGTVALRNESNRRRGDRLIVLSRLTRPRVPHTPYVSDGSIWNLGIEISQRLGREQPGFN